MSQKIVLEGPVNSTSLGQTFVNILYALYKKDVKVIFFPVSAQADLTAFNGLLEEDFVKWIQSSENKNVEKFKKDTPYLKWWHIRGSEKKITNNSYLYTFHELDQVTPSELNICESYNKVFFPNKTTVDVFSDYGLENAQAIPLAFDKLSFKVLDKKYLREQGIITFGLYGKAEHRKNHIEVIKAWSKKYGNNHKYRLNMCLFNHFLPSDQKDPRFKTHGFEAFLRTAFEGKPKPFNINILPFLQSNQEYNDILNAADIVLDMSGGESWSLPSFTSVGLGKYGVILNATGMKEWANEQNAVLVKPQGKKPSADGLFFSPQDTFNQGNFYCFDEDQFLSACEIAEEKYKQNPVNEEGLKLQEDFTYEKTVDKILEQIK